MTDAALALLQQALGAQPIRPEDRPIQLSLSTSQATPVCIVQIRQILARHPGPRPVTLALVHGDRRVVLQLPVKVDARAADDLLALLGRYGVTP